MKKVLLILAVALLATNFSYSQALNAAGDKQLNFGIGSQGHSNGYYGGFRSNGLYVGFDYVVVEDLSIGLNVGLNRWGGNHYSVTFISPAFVADYHFNTLIGIPSQFDFYAGADLGLPLSFGNGGSAIGDFDFGTHVGGRWYWSDKWGLNLQLGLGILSGGNGASFGLSMKL